LLKAGEGKAPVDESEAKPALFPATVMEIPIEKISRYLINFCMKGLRNN
jgi:hypothetical protein